MVVVYLPRLAGLVLAMVLCLASWPAFPAEASVLRVGTLSDPSLTESSGVVPCSGSTNRFWTHNDGKRPVLYAVGRSGRTISEFRIAGTSIVDWEDIARDDRGNLYLADIGNNDTRRTEVAVHAVPEPDPSRGGVISVTRSWKLRFPGAPFDCESLFIHDGHGFVISKVSKDARAVIYRFKLGQTNTSEPVVLERVAELPVTSPVTGADISADARRLAIVAKSGAFIFQIDGDVAKAEQVKPLFARFREGQIEGCCFVPGGLLAVSEKREIFLFPEKAFKAR